MSLLKLGLTYKILLSADLPLVVTIENYANWWEKDHRSIEVGHSHPDIALVWNLICPDITVTWTIFTLFFVSRVAISEQPDLEKKQLLFHLINVGQIKIVVTCYIVAATEYV